MASFTIMDVLSGKVRLPEPYATQYAMHPAGSPEKNEALMAGMGALLAQERAIEQTTEAAEKIEQQLKTQLAPLKAAAAEIREQKIRRFAPPTVLAVVAGWVAVVVAGVTVYRWFRDRKKKKRA